MKSTSRGSSAVVIGGSIAGLLAARVLSDHFDRVTIVERDRYPERPAARAGVVQSPHVHVLLARGLQLVEGLLPGIQAELQSAGALILKGGEDIAWLTPAGWGVRFRSGIEILAFSRPLLDWAVRRRVAELANITILEGYDVTGLLPTGEGNRGAVARVGGVALRRRRVVPTDERDTLLHADLVVDASGRSSRTPDWLEALDLPRPEETVINGHLGYASRFYQQPNDHDGAQWKAIFVQAAPPERTRAGLLFPVEGNRWLLTLVGGDKDYPPTDEAEFDAFAASLASPIIHEAVRCAKPLSSISGHRGTENRLRHYERVDRWPDGLLVIGDAACAFNPVYGQGMTIAALEAAMLDELLAEGAAAPGFARRFQKRLANLVELPWSLATSEDFRYRQTTGPAPGLATRLKQRYVGQVLALTTHDAFVRQLWIEVFNMLRPPSALVGPKVLLRVVKQLVFGPPSSVDGAGRPSVRYSTGMPRGARVSR